MQVRINGPRRIRKLDRQEVFLRAVEQLGSVTLAADVTGIDPYTHWNEWMQDPDYVVLFETRRKRYAEVLEGELHHRAVEGWDEPVYQGGVLVGHVKKKSDALLLAALRANARARFGDKLETINANLNANVAVPLAIDISKMSADELRALEVVLAAVAQQPNPPQPAAAGSSGALPPVAPAV